MYSERFNNRINKYTEDYLKYGYSPLSMAMLSDRRTIRYEELVKNFTFYKNRQERFTFFDAGCGFGDVIKYLDYLGCKNYTYIGVDAVKEFIEFARGGYSERRNISFSCLNYFEDDLNSFEFDYAISSQTFNDPYSEDENNIELIKEIVEKLYSKAKRGISFNFVTDKVQFMKEGVAYHSPEEILRFAYSLSNCVFMDNGCMPYECTCTILKDSAYDGLIYDTFREKNKEEFAKEIFVVKPKET